jgi:putative membrane protein
VIVLKQRQRWLQLVLTYRGSALQRIKGRLSAVFLVALAVTVAAESFGLVKPTITLTPFTLVGLALSIFLGFRNNTSYDRFWEGRRLFGALVNVTRSFARQCQLYIVARESEAQARVRNIQRELTQRTIAYAHALRMHLREGIEWDELAAFLPAEELAVLREQRNVPLAILNGTAHWLRAAWQAGHVETLHVPELERALGQLTDIQGGCERIRSTPIPHSYTVLIHSIVACYCFALPFGLVESLHLWTPAVVLIVAYAFLGLDAVGDEIENPFGLDLNDLPLSALTRMVEVNLRQTLGDNNVPELLEPVDGVLT